MRRSKFHSWRKGKWLIEDGIVSREDTCKKCGCQRTSYLKENAKQPPYLDEWIGGYTFNLVPSSRRPECKKIKL